MRVCGLFRIPNRQTLDRRLVIISNDIKYKITTMGKNFVYNKIINLSNFSSNITLIKAKVYVRHKSSMTEGVIPRSGIDTDLMGRFSHTKVGYLDTNYI